MNWSQKYREERPSSGCIAPSWECCIGTRVAGKWKQKERQYYLFCIHDACYHVIFDILILININRIRNPAGTRLDSLAWYINMLVVLQNVWSSNEEFTDPT